MIQKCKNCKNKNHCTENKEQFVANEDAVEAQKILRCIYPVPPKGE